MSQLWIVDRSPRRRASLARLAAAPESAVLGAPGEPRFETAPTPDVVLLSLDVDFEQELQFAFATRQRTERARFVLFGPRELEETARSAFDTRRIDYFAFPPRADVLRASLRQARVRRSLPVALSQRQHRASVAERFALWFEDAELPDLLAALDPKIADVPVMIRGEPGSGRGLVARYLHLFSGPNPGALAHVACHPGLSAGDLQAQLAEVVDATEGGGPLTVWLEDPNHLGLSLQRTVLDWLESGVPAGVRASRVRWIGTLDEAGFETLDPGLRLALCGISAQLPALRDRPHAIQRIAAETIRAWCAARQERPRRLAEDALSVLEEYPWPGNLRELDAVVTQSLAAGSADPLRADDLQIEGEAFSPIDAGVIAEPVADEADPGAPEIATQLIEPSSPDPAPTPSEQEIEALLDETPLETAADDGPGEEAGAGLAALARAASTHGHHPIETLRTFAALLPHRFSEVAFRDRFAEALRDDAGRMQELVERLDGEAHLGPPKREKVDVTALLEALLERRRQQIRSQRLLVLKELDTQEPNATCDPAQLRFALDTLLGKALDWVPPQGDVYLASRHHPATGSNGPSVRVLVRFHDPDGGSSASDAREPVEHSLELMICEVVVRSQGGSLTVTSTEGEETVLVLDLPA